MKRKYLTPLLASFILLLFACEKIEAPYLELVDRHIDTGQNTGDTSYKRIVLLEDFTGHKCVNCPEAAALAHQLSLAHSNQLVIIGVHAGFFASPDASGNYTADYRTPEGNALNEYFGIMMYPTGLINRKPYHGTLRLTPDKWEAALEAALQGEPEAFITLKNYYNANQRKLQVQTKVKALSDLTGPINLTLCIIENDIVSPQKNNKTSVGPVPDILDYKHKHVLRACLNGVWGEPVNGGLDLTRNTYFSFNHSFVLPDNWNADHCEVVAFLHFTSGDRKDEVIQAAARAILE
ncbi:MAG: Omp28 family outer membrane lipoprotein [Bacteroidales bacterium]